LDDITGTTLPYITDEHVGIGGQIKANPDDFRVEEIPLYEADGEGQHLYLTIRRRGMTTPQVARRLESLADVDGVAVGYAGKKDKQAVVEQRFSVDLPGRDAEPVVSAVRADDDLTLLGADWHRNKLKPGHLVGNKFRTVVRDIDTDQPLDRAKAIIQELIDRGMANFYGGQRFGRDGDNAERGLAMIQGERIDAPRWQRRLFKNAYQSALFNRWLIERIDRGDFETLLNGDIAKKTDTGGLFTVERLDDERPRFDSGAITYTGPMFGDDLWWAAEEAGDHERAVLENAEVSLDALSQAGLSGTRRRARVVLDSVEIEPVDDATDALQLTFSLPKGTYATVLLRELTKSDPA